MTHDVGNAVLNWMYSLPVTQIPPMPGLPQMCDDFIGAHRAGRDNVKIGRNFSFKATHELYMDQSTLHQILISFQLLLEGMRGITMLLDSRNQRHMLNMETLKSG